MADILDFESLLDASPASRDAAAERRLFSERITAQLGPRSGERREVFHAWLQTMRAEAPATLPGAAYDTGRRAAQALALGPGLLAGAGLTGSLLAHGTAEPVNALLFLGATVGLQVAFLALVLAAWLARRAGLDFGPVRGAWLAVVALAGRWLKRQRGERRDALRAALAGLQRRSAAHAALLQCELLLVTQGFAIAFNLGILGAMLLFYLPFVELRFGWQSTYSIGAAAVHQALQLIALPWHWIATDLVPTAQQVIDSRYTRGQSAQSLPPDAAHAWWPFLLCAVACYGLLLRCGVALLAAASLRWRLARLDFQHPQANALWRRLNGPLVSSGGADARLPEGLAQAAATAGAPAAALLVRSDELSLDDGRAAALAQGALGWHIERCLSALVDDDRLPPALSYALRNAPDGVVVLLPAALDPIVAVAGFLRALCRPGSELVLLLLGRVDGSAVAAVPAERLAIWRRFVAIQGLLIGVEANE